MFRISLVHRIEIWILNVLGIVNWNPWLSEVFFCASKCCVNAFVQVMFFNNPSQDICELWLFEIFNTSWISIVFSLCPITKLCCDVDVIANDRQISTAWNNLILAVLPSLPAYRIQGVCNYDCSSFVHHVMERINHCIVFSVLELVTNKRNVEICHSGFLLLDVVLKRLQPLSITITCVHTRIDKLSHVTDAGRELVGKHRDHQHDLSRTTHPVSQCRPHRCVLVVHCPCTISQHCLVLLAHGHTLIFVRTWCKVETNETGSHVIIVVSIRQMGCCFFFSIIIRIQVLVTRMQEYSYLVWRIL